MGIAAKISFICMTNLQMLHEQLKERRDNAESFEASCVPISSDNLPLTNGASYVNCYLLVGSLLLLATGIVSNGNCGSN